MFRWAAALTRPSNCWARPGSRAVELAQYLNARNISGVRFVPVTFTPNASIHAGQKCEGVNIFLVDRNALDAAELGIELASALHKLYPEPISHAAHDRAAEQPVGV